MAEKYQALRVNLGMTNSRMKDFYDLRILARRFDFEGPVLRPAIERTFARRDTTFPEQTPTGLSPRFFSDRQKNLQWKTFIRKGALLSSSTSPSLEEACDLLESFLMPPTNALTRRQNSIARWQGAVHGGPDPFSRAGVTATATP